MSTDNDTDALIAQKTATVASATSVVSSKRMMEEKAIKASKVPWWSTTDAMTISASVLVFGVLVMVLASRALHKGIPAALVMRLFGMLTIVVMAVFLVVAGYDSQQIAPVTGLLGTLAGYLLGKSTTAEVKDAAGKAGKGAKTGKPGNGGAGVTATPAGATGAATTGAPSASVAKTQPA